MEMYTKENGKKINHMVRADLFMKMVAFMMVKFDNCYNLKLGEWKEGYHEGNGLEYWPNGSEYIG